MILALALGCTHGELVAEEPPRLVLNEVQTDNDSTLQLPDDSLPDWVELYDADDVPVDLARVTLSEGDRVWRGSGTLDPGGFALLIADGAEGHLPFTLDSDGAELVLAWDDVPIDHLATGVLAGDTAWARVPDGGAWGLTISPSPGAANIASTTTDPTDYLYQTDRVLQFDLSIPPRSRAALDADPYSPVDASLGFEGVRFPVTVHLKGQWGSLRNLDQKAAFKVDLNDIEPHAMHGENKLTLNNMVQDPTGVHELLAYTVYRAMGVPAPRVAYAELTVDGEEFGLYALVESIDDRFLARWFADPTGDLYEGAYGADVVPDGVWSLEQHQGAFTDRQDLVDVAQIAVQDPDDVTLAALDHVVDLDEIARNMAIESGILHWDGYFYPNNYRLYADPVTGRMSIIPWGTDQTFTSMWYAPWDGQGVLHTDCMRNAACRARYDGVLRDTADTIESLGLEARMDETLALIEPYQREHDPRAEYDWDTHLGMVALTRDNVRAAPGWLRDWAAQDGH